MDNTVFILGTGRSLLALTDDERTYLDAHPRTLAMNRYYLYYEKLGVSPKMLFLSDFNYYADLILRHTVDKLRDNGHRLPYYLSEPYFQFYCSPPYRHVGFKRRMQRKFREGFDYHPQTLPDYDDFISFPVANEAPVFRWARDFSAPLYHRRGSLTVAINLANILYPACDIKLLGIDLSTPGYFYDEAITEANRDLWVDDKYDQSKKQGVHANARPKSHDSLTLCEVMRDVMAELERQGRRLRCCNENSLLVTDGVVPYAPVVERAVVE